MTSTTTTASRIPIRPVLHPAEQTREPESPQLPPRKEFIDAQELKRSRRLRAVLGTAVVVVSMGLLALGASMLGGDTQSDESLVFYTVARRDLPIVVKERGTLESQNNVEVICEVDDIHGDGIYGTPILWIVDNGSSVQKGDLLVELDASSHLERLDEQILDTERAQTKYTQARLHYENRLTRNETLKARAELNLNMAQLNLMQYEDEEGGTFQIELQDVELDIQQREAQREIDQRNLVGIEHLFKRGYKSKGDLAQAQLNALRADSALNREIARRRELVDYSYARAKLKLTGELESAQRALIQVEQDNEAELAKAKAWMDSAELSLKREKERLVRYREQLEKCKIYAPQSGMVAYHVEASRWGQQSSIGEGVAVRERQPILSIPSLTEMQVKTSVHESVVDRVKAEMPVTVRLDAFPDRSYDGTVDSVAVLPDRGGWLSSDTKVYKTNVTIEDTINVADGLKPGMTAVVEIHIDYLTDVLCVPAQALVQRGEETWCYVSRAGKIERCVVDAGATNDKFVEICSGLQDGERVVLNPMAIVEAEVTQKRIGPDEDQVDDTAIP